MLALTSHKMFKGLRAESVYTEINKIKMRTKFLTLALATLTIGLLGSCEKDNGPETPQKNLPEGALSGVFTVKAAAGTEPAKKVHFSKGNLYAKKDGEVWKWDFYSNQYDCNSLNSQCDDGRRLAAGADNEIDLFTWGYDASNSIDPVGMTGIGGHTADNDKQLYPSEDWGSQVGDGSTWRTLTTSEWRYLLKINPPNRMVNGKPGCSNAVSGISIGGTTYKGVFLYPDNYNGDVVSSSMSWDDINAAGIVFLPAAGTRYGSNVKYVGGRGLYWSSSASDYDNDLAYNIYFNSSNVFPSIGDDRDIGCSVRLITESE